MAKRLVNAIWGHELEVPVLVPAVREGLPCLPGLAATTHWSLCSTLSREAFLSSPPGSTNGFLLWAPAFVCTVLRTQLIVL